MGEGECKMSVDKKVRLAEGHYFKCHDKNDGTEFIGQYMGREKGFECMVCGFGHIAYCFNLYHTEESWDDYETFSYGKEHLPEIIEDLGVSKKPILGWS